MLDRDELARFVRVRALRTFRALETLAAVAVDIPYELACVTGPEEKRTERQRLWATHLCLRLFEEHRKLDLAGCENRIARLLEENVPAMKGVEETSALIAERDRLRELHNTTTALRGAGCEERMRWIKDWSGRVCGIEHDIFVRARSSP